MKHSEKTPVRLRAKELKGGAKSLYLDIYKDGARKYVYLKLYLSPERTAAAKRANAETMAAAELQRAKYLREFMERGGVLPRVRPNLLLLDWVESQTRERMENGAASRALLFRGVREHLELYKGKNVRLSDVDTDFVRGFIAYLSTAESRRHAYHASPLSASTKQNYFFAFKVMIETAHKRGLIDASPFAFLSPADVKPLKAGESVAKIDYLTSEELETLKRARCGREDVRRAFLFACYTGLRVSDVQAVKWANVEEMQGTLFLRLRMQKTREIVSFPLSKQAAAMLPERTAANATAPLFPLPTNPTINAVLQAWAMEAKIQKRLHFHVARHTFATLALSAGVDVYTLAKFLGHKKISSTQIYADLLAKDMIAATKKIEASL